MLILDFTCFNVQKGFYFFSYCLSHESPVCSDWFAGKDNKSIIGPL